MDLPAGLDYNAFRAAVKGRYSRTKLSAAWKAYKSSKTAPSRTYESVKRRGGRARGGSRPSPKRSASPGRSPPVQKGAPTRSKLATALAEARVKKAAARAVKTAATSTGTPTATSKGTATDTRTVDVDEETYSFWVSDQPEGLTSPFAAPEPHTWYTMRLTGPAVITLREPLHLAGGGYVRLTVDELDAVRGEIKNALYDVRVAGRGGVLEADERDVALSLDREFYQKDGLDLVELSVTPLYTPESAAGRIVWAVREWLSRYAFTTADGRKVQIG
jgi:hypothetical protein